MQAKRLTLATIICAFLVFIVQTSRAATSLSQEELADGWIQLFDGETLFGWTRMGNAQWEVVDGSIVCQGWSGGWIATTSQFADYELQMKVKVKTLLKPKGRDDWKPVATAGIVVRGGLESYHAENGSGHFLVRGPLGADAWQDVIVKADGDKLSATVDGKPVAELSATRRRGYIGIQYHHNRACRLEIKDVRLRPLNSQSIFNGEDLSEWNIIPGKKSKFSVIDGAINIKNGSGQIETVGVYRDFLLQMDIFSNGTHLNSGVFYRGFPGQFWTGYESQVRNQWEKDDRTQPKDYGTGGNYGNQPARTVVSSDGEWFHKTIVCDGNHAAVWINGYLVSDFLDTRPLSTKYGKQGYMPGPGTIHLQGHDPKTDLSFRNIQISEYPE